MANVILVSTDYVKQSTVIDENVDDKFIRFAILDAQEQTLQELIGTDLLEELKTQVETSTLTAVNTTLLNIYVVPYLAAQVVADAVIPMQYKFRNKSVSSMSSEEANAVSDSNVAFLIREYNSKAQFKGERLRKYLLGNSSTYPLYLNGNTDLWKIRPIGTAYQTGMFLGNQRKPSPRIYNESSLQEDNWIHYPYSL